MPLKILLCALALLMPVLTYAQGPGFGGGVEDVPIDGGLSLAIAGGVAYGAKKIHDRRKKEKTGANH